MQWKLGVVKRLLLAMTLLCLFALAQPALAADTVYYYSSDSVHSEVEKWTRKFEQHDKWLSCSPSAMMIAAEGAKHESQTAS